MHSVVKTVLGSALTLAAIGLLIFTIVSLATRPTIADRCETPTLPFNLWVDKIDGNFLVSWSNLWPNADCDVTYHLQYSVDDGQEFRVNITVNRYTISNLIVEYCSILQLRLWVINNLGVISEDSITNNHRVLPSDVHVTDINFTNVIEGLLVTWNKPIELIGCDVDYTFSITSDHTSFATVSDTESVTILQEKYCFQVTIIISTWVEGRIISSTVDRHSDRAAEMDSVQIRISTNNPQELIVSWDNHPQEEICSIEYVVSFFSDGIEDTQTVNVTNPEATFNFIYCADAVVRVITYGLNGSTLGPIGVLETIQYPEYHFDISVISLEAAKLISWYESPLIETCNVTYLVNIRTDLGDFTNRITESSIEFPEELYCFFFTVQIEAVIGETIGNPTIADFQLDLDPVDELELIREESGDILIASWTPHRTQEQCGIEYAVTFGDGIINQTTITNQSSINFDISYCTTVFAIVEAASGTVISESDAVTYETGSPILIGKVQDVSIDDALSGSITVSWKSAAYINQCDIEYTVTATHPTSGEAICSGNSSCDIILSEFCPSTNLVITATKLDGQPVSGEPTTEIYIC